MRDEFIWILMLAISSISAVDWNWTTVTVTKQLGWGQMLFARGGRRRWIDGKCYNRADQSVSCSIPIRFETTGVTQRLSWDGNEGGTPGLGFPLSGVDAYGRTTAPAITFQMDCDQADQCRHRPCFQFKVYFVDEHGVGTWEPGFNHRAYCGEANRFVFNDDPLTKSSQTDAFFGRRINGSSNTEQIEGEGGRENEY